MANSRLCSIPNCNKPFLALGCCKSHYNRLKRYGDPLGGMALYGSTINRLCKVEGCTQSAYWRNGGKGEYCNLHYRRLLDHGDTSERGTPSGEPLRFLQEEVLTYDGDDCLIWPYSRNAHGYGKVWIDGKLLIVSRHVCEIANGAPPTPKHHAAHSCGKGHLGCVTKGHLSWKTPTENSADRVEHGTILRGSELHMTKLTEENVRFIRSMRGKLTQKALATMFEVSQSRISSIQHRYDWAWLD